MSDSTTGQNQSVGKKGGSNKLVIVVGAVIIVLLLAIIAILLISRKPESVPESAETGKRVVLVDDDNISKIAEQLEADKQEYVAPGRYIAMMNYEWHFAKGTMESTDAYVANSNQNTHDIYFDVFLEGDEENAIYESPIIPRGREIRKILLNRELDAGTYDCILVYHLVDEQQNTISTASFALEIIIEG